ncbi:hypothetical protein IEO21_08213 [Rhodonia placenta]|uniref:Uncharacterized protein n=1 Tax=Rhodonia placenta TaxID=104341 RepID=A0A8H7TYX9_9APHY|nr:hypothetical protein IEO21_08213 [Postia placenta]
MTKQAQSSPTRVAIVTGAAQGIGKAIALRLADDGLDIAVNDISTKADQLASVVQQIQHKGRRAIIIPGDVSHEPDVIMMVKKTVSKLGGLDVMVANAGVTMFKPMFDTTVEDFERIMAVNVQGVMLCFKHAAQEMAKQGRGGRLIGACSGSGKKGIQNMAVYSASKFAVRGLTQSCAAEWAKYKITVNNYAPGGILTPMILHPDDDINGGPASTAKKMAGLPLDLPDAEPDIVAGLVSYLVKPEAYHITGQSINIDGGMFYD